MPNSKAEWNAERFCYNIQIEAGGGSDPKFSILAFDPNDISRGCHVVDAFKVFGGRCLLDVFEQPMRAMLGDCWDGEWKSVPPATYIVDSQELTSDLNDYFYRRAVRVGVVPAVIPTQSSAAPAKSAWGKKALTQFPRFWELFGFLLPLKTRERVFEPAYNDLLAQHLKALNPKFETPIAICWLNLCFFVRSAGLVASCYKGLLSSTAIAAAWKCAPASVKEWLWSIFRW